jgi:hypothetical protein
MRAGILCLLPGMRIIWGEKGMEFISFESIEEKGEDHSGENLA